MSIAEFIREKVLKPRLKEKGCLVVYDADKRFREQCFDLASDKIKVVDASISSIESREAALLGLKQLGNSRPLFNGILIYVPAQKPVSDEQKQKDPFALYAECGAVFPQNDGDEYLNICLRAKPDHGTEIRRVFSGTPAGPGFAVIDAIGGGIGWPQLRAILKVDSVREILEALLVPTESQIESLKKQEGWVQESRDFLRATLEMNVKTRSKSWESLADELWRYILFSEFVFDLPVELPESLKTVPHSPKEARPIIDDVCDRLRNTQNSISAYIERAEAIEGELTLAVICGAIEDLGIRDTFPFEERTYLKKAVKGILANETDTTRLILTRHQASVWLGKGEIQAQWELVRSALGLVEVCDDLERRLPDHTRTQADLLDFYIVSLREADRLQREFEQAVGEFADQHEFMNDIIKHARARYSR